MGKPQQDIYFEFCEKKGLYKLIFYPLEITILTYETNNVNKTNQPNKCSFNLHYHEDVMNIAKIEIFHTKVKNPLVYKFCSSKSQKKTKTFLRWSAQIWRNPQHMPEEIHGASCQLLIPSQL